jgi:hypothetical protein
MAAGKKTLDFIVIGAQKAGTTSLFEYLRHHPEVCLPANKESPYFSHDAKYAQGWDSYLKKTFAAANPACMWGTVTPSDMIGGVYDSGTFLGDADSRYDERTVPLRIRELMPDVRLIAILRDPVQRAISHHRMWQLNGLERRSFDEAIGQLLRPDSLEHSRKLPEETTGYVTWGEYGRILAGYFDVFPREQILVVFTDELDHAPDLLLLRLYEFLGISSAFVPDNLGTRYRAGGTKRRLSWFKIGEARRAVAHNPTARSLWRALPDAIRHPIDSSFERIVYRIDLWNRRGSENPEEPSPATLRCLREHFAQDTQQLTALLEMTPPWQTPATAE